ncbi:hypothetical protein HD554DRAFT_2173736 [Boletus coccyginus]|nr:hypothetical protein HD554DRAFT_2176916 [Boletus coccyginus]KAI9567124.1 hypothetical protein HD554DRAFT_2173736 [Boletus coccyginus]
MSSYPARYLPYRRYPPRSRSFCQLPAEVERSLSAGSSRPADRAISGDCPHRSALTSSPKDDGEASDNAMDTTPIHNDARPVVYIYAQDWRQYVGRQMEVRVAQSLGDEIEVRVNRAVASALAGLRTTPDSHKGAHHQKTVLLAALRFLRNICWRGSTSVVRLAILCMAYCGFRRPDVISGMPIVDAYESWLRYPGLNSDAMPGGLE